MVTHFRCPSALKNHTCFNLLTSNLNVSDNDKLNIACQWKRRNVLHGHVDARRKIDFGDFFKNANVIVSKISIEERVHRF